MKLPISASSIDAFLRTVCEVHTGSGISTDEPSCDSIAAGWRKLGLRPGDIVLLCLPNGRQLLQQFFGVLIAGGVPALVAPMTPAARLRELSQMLDVWGIGSLRLPNGDLGAESFEQLGSLHVARLAVPPNPAAQPGEVVMLTSGTSGLSSGCVFKFESILLNAERHADAIGQRPRDVVLVSLPQYFSFALVAQTLGSFVRGSRLMIAGPPFYPVEYRKALQELGVTVSSLTPFLIRSLLKKEFEFPTELRALTVGGDALAPDHVEHLLRIRPDRELYLTYGLTQAGPRVSTLAAHAESPKRYSSVGLPLAGTSVFLGKIDDSSELEQLCVSSDTVMERSIGRIEGRAAQKSLPPKTIATGDAFEIDTEGYLYFRGRLSDYISRSGEKISLAAIRRVATQLPGVISAKTVVIRNEAGEHDFDLELALEATAEVPVDSSTMLRGLLRHADMPRQIRVLHGSEVLAHSYK